MIQKIISDFLTVDNLDTEAVNKASKALMDYMDGASDSEKSEIKRNKSKIWDFRFDNEIESNSIALKAR